MFYFYFLRWWRDDDDDVGDLSKATHTLFRKNFVIFSQNAYDSGSNQFKSSKWFLIRLFFLSFKNCTVAIRTYFRLLSHNNIKSEPQRKSCYCDLLNSKLFIQSIKLLNLKSFALTEFKIQKNSVTFWEQRRYFCIQPVYDWYFLNGMHY